MRKYIVLLAALILSTVLPYSADSATRTYNSPRNIIRKLTKQFNGAADVFVQADPSPAGTPLTLTSATGRSGEEGSVTVHLMAGFTAPLLLTVYQWSPTEAAWIRCAPAATGANVYQQSVDTNYALVQFSIAERVPFIIRADKSVTGNVYVDCEAHPANNNTAP